MVGPAPCSIYQNNGNRLAAERDTNCKGVRSRERRIDMRFASICVLVSLLVLLVPRVCGAAEVADAVTCLGIENREPVGADDSFPADVGRVWCWSKIKDGQGTAITHAYYYGDEEKALVELEIRSPLFRTYSSKRVLPSWTGEWRVDIVDDQGDVLKSLHFTIGEETQPEEENLTEESGSTD
jgi:hypothetical protein